MPRVSEPQSSQYQLAVAAFCLQQLFLFLGNRLRVTVRLRQVANEVDAVEQQRAEAAAAEGRRVATDSPVAFY